MMLLANGQWKCKIWNPSAFLMKILSLACERICIKTYSIESRCYRTGKYTVCRRVYESFSPEILQAEAVKGLMLPFSIFSYVSFTVFISLPVPFSACLPVFLSLPDSSSHPLSFVSQALYVSVFLSVFACLPVCLFSSLILSLPSS